MGIRFSPSSRGFYHPDQEAPTDAVEITDEAFEALMAAQTAGHVIAPDAAGAPVAVAAPAPSLADVQAALCTDVDRQAQLIRDRYVTPGGAQAATYMFKQTEAVQAQAAQGTTDAGKTAEQLAALYPDLANEVGITLDPQTGQPAADLYGVMRAVLATLAVWLPLNRAIEATRLRTKAAIMAATTPEAAQAAHDGVVWPGPA